MDKVHDQRESPAIYMYSVHIVGVANTPTVCTLSALFLWVYFCNDFNAIVTSMYDTNISIEFTISCNSVTYTASVPHSTSI